MFNKIKALVDDEEGASMVEYALLVALIAVACITVIGTLSTKVQGTFTSAANGMP